jgi:hypothetical protein
VELGKILADAIQPALAGQGGELPADIPGLDGLVAYIKGKSALSAS